MSTATAAPVGVINLDKGQKIDLTKGNDALKVIGIGLGWNPRVSADEPFDLDAAVVCLKNKKYVGVPGAEDVCYFRALNLFAGAIVHSGDNLTGQGDGDDETITVNLDAIPADITELMVVVNIYQASTRNQNFGKVDGAYCRVFNGATQQEIAKFDLSEDHSMHNAMVMGKLYRHGDEWKFEAVGTGMNGDLNVIAASFNS